MPRIGENVLGCIFYFYGTEADADAGVNPCGTGFILGVPRGWPEPLAPQTTEQRTLLVIDKTKWPHVTRGEKEQDLLGGTHYYAVTNAHLVRSKRLVARFNARSGGTHSIPIDPGSWVLHPDLDDIAVWPAEFDKEDLEHNGVGLDQLLSKELAQEFDLGPGDECVFFGLYSHHSGGARRNKPAMRFGFISRMADPDDRLRTRQPGGSELLLEGYLVEGKSQPGFSGSPVFAYFPPWHLAQAFPGQSARLVAWEKAGLSWWLLGLNWSHFPDFVPAEAVDDNDKPTGEKFRLLTNSGMMCVSPAWKLIEVLNLPELVQKRWNESTADRRLREIVEGRPKSAPNPPTAEG